MQTVQPDAREAPGAFTQAMTRLLHPQRIAVVGASPKPGFASNIMQGILRQGYEGELYPITPRYESVLDLPAYPTLQDTPHPADVAIIVVPNHLVLGILESCERGGVGAVDIISSGFGEKPGSAVGQEQQAAITDFARRTGIRVVGPNCLGNISVPAKMLAMSGPYPALRRGAVALALQSGLLAYSLVIPLHDRGLGFTYMVTLGNEADLEVADIIRYCVDDEETQVIGCFVEQFRNPEKFFAAAEAAAARSKPIVILKVGRSEVGQRSALAHTGSLVGSDGVADAVLRQYGITRVYNLDEMLEALAIFHTKKLPRGSGVAPVFASGGAVGLVADLGSDIGVSFPPLAPETSAHLETILPEFGTVGNPLDVTGQVAQQPEVLRGALTALADDPSIDIVVYGRAFPSKLDLAEPAGQVLKQMTERYLDKLFMLMALVSGEMKHAASPMRPPVEPVVLLDNIPFLNGAENGLKAIAALVRYAEFQRSWQTEARPGSEPGPLATQARDFVRASNGRPLVEREAKELLALYGLPVVKEELASSGDQAVSAARRIGFPVVMKIESPDLPHKTEAGGVLLNVADEEAVRQGYAQIIENARRYRPDAAISGVLVQEQVTGGRELIVGMSRDPQFGPAIAVGLGGVFVETLRDIALGVPPLTPRDARGMLSRLRGAAILEGSGSRGMGPVDLDAIVDFLHRFAQLCIDLRDEVAEIDINPLLALPRGQGVRVVDALIIPADDGA